jgi:mannose-6-phosphate isomerase-like protein (cupin superfamily)
LAFVYEPEYSKSWALVVGINKYEHASPLGYACNDAVAISKLLIEQFEFPEENVTLLLDEEATQSNIMRNFLKFANGNTLPNDRLIVFYAGHGHTISGHRGEVGFLIPHDGTIDDLSTCIKWNDLTGNSDLIDAKHLLFVMDACYGGLAITRSLPPGSARFLEDMMKRYSRQVLTAGKANEVVADAGGPIPGHSIFTGHFIEGLMGAAAKGDGIITANGVMSYVYDKVSKDMHSQQSPHYGFLSGDGDFIFNYSIIKPNDSSSVGSNEMIEVPAVFDNYNQRDERQLIDRTKEYLSEDRHRIKLEDLINQELRQTMALINDNFTYQGRYTESEFIDRLKKYENIIKNIQAIVISISQWGNQFHLSFIRKIISRLTEHNSLESGLSNWMDLRSYPIFLLLYSGGISAVASERYDMLATLFSTKIQNERRNKSEEVILSTVKGQIDIQDAYKTIPGHERNHTPRSEYLYKLLQPTLDDMLFLGKSYETIFDRFEVFLALVYADFYSPDGSHVWGPPGRFAWKHSAYEDSPLRNVIREASSLKEEWPPIKAGLFSGSYDRFKLISDRYLELVNGWHY